MTETSKPAILFTGAHTPGCGFELENRAYLVVTAAQLRRLARQIDAKVKQNPLKTRAVTLNNITLRAYRRHATPAEVQISSIDFFNPKNIL